MRFRVTGRDRLSGQSIEMVFESTDAQAALASAQARDMVVDAINPVSTRQDVPPPIYQQHVRSVPQSSRPTRKKGLRWWAVLIVLVALIGPAIEPLIGFVIFGLLSLTIVLYMVPGTKALSRSMLGLSVGRPFATSIKMIFVGLLAMVVLLISIGSQNERQARQQAEVDRVKADAERKRLIAEGNAKVDTLMRAVERKLNMGDVAGASATLAELLKIQQATNKGPGRRLHESIALSSDSEAVRRKLLELSEEEFAVFASGSKVPSVFNLGYQVLSDMVVNLARPMVEDVKLERAALAKKSAEEAEQRRKEELVRAESERKERERKTAAEAAAKVAAQREVKDKLDAYMAVIQLDDFATKIVDRVAVERRGDGWTATITVKNLWHIRNKQLRLQDAQNLWQAWAVLASKNDPDKARIKLIDLNGNEVGGSRILGGSLIWVQD